MTQNITCPECKHTFSLADAHKKEVENIKENAKKLGIAEAKAEKAEVNKKLAAREKELKAKEEKIKFDKEKLAKDAKKQAEAVANKKLAAREKESKAKEEKIKFDNDKNLQKVKKDYEKRLQTGKKEHFLDIQRIKDKAKITSDIASQTAVEKKGEAQEELLEDFLKAKFPYDKIEPVKKGKKGGDLIQTVIDKKNNQAGIILHERKEVLKFDEYWINKLLNDMAKINATQGIIFTKSMPKKSNGLWQEREGGRIIICSEDYLLLELTVSLRRKIILQDFFHKSDKNNKGGNLKPLEDFLSSNEFKLQYRKSYKNLKSEIDQIEKDERSFGNQIMQRKKNYEDKKLIMNNILPKILMKANLPDFLDGIDEDNLLE